MSRPTIRPHQDGRESGCGNNRQEIRKMRREILGNDAHLQRGVEVRKLGMDLVEDDGRVRHGVDFHHLSVFCTSCS